MWLFLSMYALSLIFFFAHFYYLPMKQRTKAKAIELLLLYQIVFSLGITSLLAFFGLTFMDQYIAKYLLWPTCPFQQELGNVNLAFGILGILSIQYRQLFWMATVLGFSIWILADAIHHIYMALAFHNYSPGNTGIPLYTDIIVPIVLLILLILYVKTNLKRKNS